MGSKKLLTFLVISTIVLAIAVILMGIFLRHGVKTTAQTNITNNESAPQFLDSDIKELTGTRLPYSWTTPISLAADEVADDDGVLLYTWKDGKNYYHPVQIATRILQYVASFIQTNDQEYINRGEIYARALLDHSRDFSGALYFPYEFDFNVHGYAGEDMLAPWYSGMAQGKALSAFVRLYKATGKGEYLEVADKIFLSFTNLKGGSEPWIAYVDEAGYYWIEEYPMEQPDHTLNGFGFAIYGLYDYYLARKDETSKMVLQETLATMKRYLAEFRNEGKISSYCLKHKLQKENYHYIHIREIRTFYYITEDEYFKTMMDSYVADYYKEE